MNYPIEKILEKYDAAPADIQAAIDSEEVAQKINQIAQGVGLSEGQAVDFADQVSFVLLGLMHPNELIKNIRETVKTSPEDAKKIADQANEAVFQPVRDSLRKMYGIGDDSAPDSQINSRIDSRGKQIQPETDTDHLLTGTVAPQEIPAPADPANWPANQTNLANKPQQMKQNAIGMIAPIPEPPKIIQTLEQDFNEAARTASAQSIAAEKLARPVSVPSQEKYVDPTASQPKPQYGTDGKYTGIDPYRETV